MEVFTLGHARRLHRERRAGGRSRAHRLQARPRGRHPSSAPATARHGAKTRARRHRRPRREGILRRGARAPAAAPPTSSTRTVAGVRVEQGTVDRRALDRLVRRTAANRDLEAMFTAMVLTDATSPLRRAGTSSVPVEWLVGAIRALQVPLDDEIDQRLRRRARRPRPGAVLPAQRRRLAVGDGVDVDRRPPISGSGSRRCSRPRTPRPSELRGSTTAKLEALAHLLGISTWSDRSLSLRGATGQPQGLLAVALNTPEYLVH